MSLTFDGYGLAAKIEDELKWKIDQLPKKPKLMVILDANNAASVKYTKLKKGFADRIGVEMLTGEPLRIAEYNIDDDINGIVIQLPFANSQFLINQITPKKDADGLREDSPYQPAAVRAVKEILAQVQRDKGSQVQSVLVVGSQGFVGKKLMAEFKCLGFDKNDFNPEMLKTADIVISATGQPGLIKPEMVKDGVVAIDLGYPTGDFAPEVANKASLFTPVPGGVGPVTVAMLFQNLLDSVHG